MENKVISKLYGIVSRVARFRGDQMGYTKILPHRGEYELWLEEVSKHMDDDAKMNVFSHSLRYGVDKIGDEVVALELVETEDTFEERRLRTLEYYKNK
jgi:hypothetical protein